MGVRARWDLLALLARRDLTLRYRQTALGAAWVVLQPLLFSGLFSFVFGSVARLPSNGIPYFLFAFTGMVAWNLFANGVGRVSGALLANSGLVSKIYFPRLILPLAALGVCAVDVLVATGAATVFVLVSGRPLSWGFLTLPLWLAALALLALGLGLAAGALVVRYRDVQYLVPLFLQMLLFASAVVYSIDAVPHRYRWIIELNPVAALVSGARWAFVGTDGPAGWAVALAVGFVALALLIGLDVFRRAESAFADVI